MRPLAATGDTWGISGSTFILVYVLIAVIVLIASTRARSAVAARRSGTDVSDLHARPYDVAYLNGGPELAVYSALSSMRVDGTIVTAGRGNVRAAGRPAAGADALERAIHFTAGTPVQRARLRYHRTVSDALDAIERRLTSGGLLLDGGERRAIRGIGGWMLAVAALGLVRIVAGVANNHDVAFLVVATLVVTVIAVVQLVRAPTRSPLGNRSLARLRAEHHELSPSNRPDWVTYGAAGAALGVGVFGMSALWASDPAFADELAAQRLASGGGSGGDGGSASSCSSGSSCSGGSSCGGGGGCGG
jgi:uncharacterized protein (TIGR04222 family)